MVVIPLKEYEKLLDAIDIADANRVKADITARIDEMIPAKIVDDLIKGGNPVRIWRNYRGLTARALAKKANLSAAYISEIENGKKEGSISSLKKIATALEVDLDDLV